MQKEMEMEEKAPTDDQLRRESLRKKWSLK